MDTADRPAERSPTGPQFHARWLLPLVAIVGAYVLFQSARGLHWRTLAPGVEFAVLRGDPWCRQGSSQVAVLRLDPAHLDIAVRHWAPRDAGHPPTIVEWQRRTGALAVFNAGQFYPGYEYMGLLVSGGRTVSRRPHPGYRAALVADPVRGPRSAHVLDLDRTPLDPDSLAWRQVAQSFMLFDRTRGLRVRRSTRVANRTVVAEGEDGRLFVVVSEGGYTLADFAEWLRGSSLRLTHAMSMDGGLEAELVVAARDFRYATFGEWDGLERAPSAPGARAPLPAVITVHAR